MRTSRLRVQLREVEPTVVRVLDVPRSSTLSELHGLLQAAMGWVDVHLHEFDSGTARYGPDDGSGDALGDGPDDETACRDEPACRDETGRKLADLGPRWVYRYDFGDGWTHDVEVLEPGADHPGCPYGEGPCPPEDCGGSTGYEHLRDALGDPAHPEHTAKREWLGCSTRSATGSSSPPPGAYPATSSAPCRSNARDGLGPTVPPASKRT